MDGQQHKYEIVINKEDLLIELSSDDVYFISKQMDKWFKILMDDSYVPVSIARPPVQPSAEPVAPVDLPIQQAPPVAPVQAPQQQALPQPQIVEQVQFPPQQQTQYQQVVQAQMPQVPPAQVQPQAMPLQPQVPHQDMSQVNLPHEMLNPAQAPVQAIPPQFQAQAQVQVMPVQPLAPTTMAPQQNFQYQQPVQVAQPQPLAPTTVQLPQAAPAPLPSAQSIPQPPALKAEQVPTQRPLLAPETQAQVPIQFQQSSAPALTAPPPTQEQIQQEGQAPQYYLPEPDTAKEPEASPKQAPEMSPVPPEITDDFERVMDTLMEDLGEENTPTQAQVPAGNSVYSPSSDINSLADLCKKANANSSEDFMLLSAYYLTHFEAIENFSLKKLNATMVKSGLTPVNHSVLETALAKGFLSMVPDLTGNMTVTEYALTPEGASKAGLS